MRETELRLRARVTSRSLRHGDTGQHSSSFPEYAGHYSQASVWWRRGAPLPEPGNALLVVVASLPLFRGEARRGQRQPERRVLPGD